MAKPTQSVCNLINDGKIAKHAVIGLTDNRGIFVLMQDSDDTRYYAFSNEADVLAMQEQRIAELVQGTSDCKSTSISWTKQRRKANAISMNSMHD